METSVTTNSERDSSTTYIWIAILLLFFIVLGLLIYMFFFGRKVYGYFQVTPGLAFPGPGTTAVSFTGGATVSRGITLGPGNTTVVVPAGTYLVSYSVYSGTTGGVVWDAALTHGDNTTLRINTFTSGRYGTTGIVVYNQTTSVGLNLRSLGDTLPIDSTGMTGYIMFVRL